MCGLWSQTSQVQITFPPWAFSLGFQFSLLEKEVMTAPTSQGHVGTEGICVCELHSTVPAT